MELTNLLLGDDKVVMKYDWTVIFGHLHKGLFGSTNSKSKKA